MLRPLLLTLALVGGGVTCLPCRAQLRTLSAGNTDSKWRDSQLQELKRQLSQPNLLPQLQRELQAQADWLSQWQTKRELAAQPTEPSPSEPSPIEPSVPSSSPADKSTNQSGENPVATTVGNSAEPSSGTSGEKTAGNAESNLARPGRMRQEPILDPNGRAQSHRQALFSTKGGPTVEDTTALQMALAEHSGDLGLRQLQMHWLDQPRYRNEYWKEIGEACGRVIALLEAEKPTEEVKLAMAFACYRRARAYCHLLDAAGRQDPAVAGATHLDLEQLQVLRDGVGLAAERIQELLGPSQPEFFQLEIYALRRDQWAGQALQLLERFADQLERSAYLAERLSLLKALGWHAPAAQTAEALSQLPAAERRQLEIQFRP